MKERPILFSAPMVRAILDGSKTQTRRIITDESIITLRPDGTPGKVQPRCRYGQPGDRLWLRETWQIHRLDGIRGTKEFPNILYAADQTTRLLIDKCVWKYVRENPAWRPSIHMPRWASRITLEITGVRVERLQDISNEDALAEGTPDLRTMENNWDMQRCFQSLWESINGADSWAANPWVWVIEFKRAA